MRAVIRLYPWSHFVAHKQLLLLDACCLLLDRWPASLLGWDFPMYASSASETVLRFCLAGGGRSRAGER